MNTTDDFPDVNFATEDGLLALGGDLSPKRLLSAYERGIFPWYNPGEPILWWSPDPRCVLYPAKFKPSRSLKRSIRRHQFAFTFDRDFESVIENCAAPRQSGPGTWITRDMKDAYIRLHEIGYAHSMEVWKDDQLAGGLYGIALGKMFFGESMFTLVTDASKAALYCLVLNLTHFNFSLVDCQITSPHLLSLGAIEIPRSEFMDDLRKAVSQTGHAGHWKDIDAGLVVRKEVQLS